MVEFRARLLANESVVIASVLCEAISYFATTERLLRAQTALAMTDS